MNFNEIPKFTKTPRYNVNVDWEDLEHHLDRYKRNYNLNMDPDFQRAHVWDDKKRTRYVEFILRGGKSGVDIYLNCPGWMNTNNGAMVLIDGKQRLNAVLKFLNDEVQAFGHKYSEFGGSLVGPGFIFHINDLKTRAEELQWYLDLNEGGVVHTSEELERVRDLLEKEKQSIS